MAQNTTTTGQKESIPPGPAARDRNGLSMSDSHTVATSATTTVLRLRRELRIESRFFQRNAISGGPVGESGNGPGWALLLNAPTLGASPRSAAALMAALCSARTIEPSSNRYSVLETQ